MPFLCFGDAARRAALAPAPPSAGEPEVVQLTLADRPAVVPMLVQVLRRPWLRAARSTAHRSEHARARGAEARCTVLVPTSAGVSVRRKRG